MMYDELIKSLREATGWKNASVHYSLMNEAAEAIEELTRENESLAESVNEASEILRRRWIPVAEDTPSDFVSVQAHIVGEEPLPTVREAYVIGGKWFFPALKEFLPVDMWRRFDEPPKEET